MDRQGRRRGHLFHAFPECAGKDKTHGSSRETVGGPTCRKETRVDIQSAMDSSSQARISTTALSEKSSMTPKPECKSTADFEMSSVMVGNRGLLQRIHSTPGFSFGSLLQLSFLLLLAFVEPARAAFIGFENCLSPNIVNSNPKQLQLIPLFVWASFNSSKSHNLNVTVYGNVAGQATKGDYPRPEDPQWNNTNSTLGKIVDISKSTNIATTLDGTFDVLDYTPYVIPDTRFSETLIQGQFPIAPVFNHSL